MGDDRGRRHLNIKYHLFFGFSRDHKKCLVFFVDKDQDPKMKATFCVKSSIFTRGEKVCVSRNVAILWPLLKPLHFIWQPRQFFCKLSAKCCSFSAVSAPIFARKYAFCSIFQNLPDYLAEIFETWQIFADFATFAKCCWIFTEIADFSNLFFVKILRLQRCKSMQIL